MASSSSSPSPSSKMSMKYDVFLSFRSEDTRNNFTSHLCSALDRKKIKTFIDDEKFIRGDEISPSLLNAIESSKISVVIFSQWFASSRWCLEELVKILECKTNHGQIVIPVFHSVDPSDVRNQTRTFGEAFSELEERFQGQSDKLQKWRDALRNTANLSGFDSNVIRPESYLIEEITIEILKRLDDMFTIDHSELVGVESPIKEIESLLNIGSRDVLRLGIWGIGGIGKTTIVDAVFNKIFRHFEDYYFVRDVREAKENGRLRQMQQEVFSKILGDNSVSIDIHGKGFNFQRERLKRKKVLLVFDDVTEVEQIEFLPNTFAPGNRIIITSRDRQVLLNCSVNENEIYGMKQLAVCEALKLFSRHAFRQDNPVGGYEEMSKKVVKYVGGVPLALKVLSCYLFKKTKSAWESEMKKIKRIPNAKIQDVLKISYDSLDDNQKSIFLDIVFLFVGKDKHLAIDFFNGCRFFPEVEMSVLVDKSLITISNKNMILVHDLLQDMGKEIVRRESINHPGKRSRLNDPEDICEVLVENKGTDVIQGISLNMDQIKEIHLNLHTFKKMSDLRFLNFYHSFQKKNKCKVSHIQGRAFTKVRYFQWDGYPLKSLPSGLKPISLVSLILRESNIKQLWDSVQNLVNLRDMDVSGSKQLKKLTDLSLATNLKTLNLGCCESLIEIHSSILHLNKLVWLSLKDCTSLKSLPASIHMKSLKHLDLNGCSNLQRLPDELGNLQSLRELYAARTAIRELPSSIGCLSTLGFLYLESCKVLESLPSSLCKLERLQTLWLGRCSNLQRLLPDELGNLESLEKLPTKCMAISSFPNLVGLRSLSYLCLGGLGITELPESLDQLSSLKDLYLDNNNFDRIPPSIIHLSSLHILSIRECTRLRYLPELPCQISCVWARGCMSLEAFSGSSFLFASEFQSTDFMNCSKLESDKVSQMVKDAHPNIQLSFTKWRREKGFDRKHFFYPRPSGIIYYPGSKIPEWFNYRETGSSIILQLPLDLCNDKFFCFQFCVVASLQGHHGVVLNLDIRFQRKLKTKGHDCNDVRIDWIIVEKESYVRSDHVVLGYFFKEYLDSESCYEDEITFHFFFGYIDKNYNTRENNMVKECGIHLLYAKEEEGEEEEKGRGTRPQKRKRDQTPKDGSCGW